MTRRLLTSTLSCISRRYMQQLLCPVHPIHGITDCFLSLMELLDLLLALFHLCTKFGYPILILLHRRPSTVMACCPLR